MAGLQITCDDLWIGSFHERRPVEELVDPLDHIHGRFGISIEGRALPSLGYFGPDDVCLNDWLHELWMVVGRLCEDPVARYEFDEGEQGQPCFRFDRDDDEMFVTVAAGSGGGESIPDWQRVKVDFAEFQNEVINFTDSMGSTITAAAPQVGTAWLYERLDPVLVEAYQRRSVTALEALLSLGLRPDATDCRWTGRPVVDLAIADGEHQVIELLGRSGADIEQADSSGLTALHRSSRSADRNNKMINTLLKCGADIRATDHHGWTALHHAAVYGYHENIKLLLNQGADRDARTVEGLTAADLATTNNHVETVKVLQIERP